MNERLADEAQTCDEPDLRRRGKLLGVQETDFDFFTSQLPRIVPIDSLVRNTSGLLQIFSRLGQ